MNVEFSAGLGTQKLSLPLLPDAWPALANDFRMDLMCVTTAGSLHMSGLIFRLCVLIVFNVITV